MAQLSHQGLRKKTRAIRHVPHPARSWLLPPTAAAHDIAMLYLVESFQLGKLIRAKLAVKTEFSNLYVPVTDKVTLQRLQRRLADMKALEAKG